jgi:hypothetical protein
MQDILKKYKSCAGKDCQRTGIHYLRVLYLNKSGWFCGICKDSLLSDSLVIKEDSVTDQRDRVTKTW